VHIPSCNTPHSQKAGTMLQSWLVVHKCTLTLMAVHSSGQPEKLRGQPPVYIAFNTRRCTTAYAAWSIQKMPEYTMCESKESRRTFSKSMCVFSSPKSSTRPIHFSRMTGALSCHCKTKNILQLKVRPAFPYSSRSFSRAGSLMSGLSTCTEHQCKAA
jgi:hypothetical protein